MDWCYMVYLLLLTWFIVAVVLIVFGDCDILLQIAEKFGKRPDSLKGKVVWVTGASSGIGEHLVYVLAKAGCKLILSARREGELERVKKSCIEQWKLSSDDILVLPLDMVEFDTHKAAVDKAIKTFKRVDILVNNAGRSQRAEWIKTTLDVDREVMNVNVFGALSLTKLVLPHMVKAKQGHIVNMSSVAGKLVAPFSGSYSGAKHALQGWFDSLRLEASEHNIAVTNICPGPVFSNYKDQAFTEEIGKNAGIEMESSNKRVATTRCAELSVIAIANGLDEVWIALNPILFFTYMFQYSPVVARFFGKMMGNKSLKKIRGGK